MPELVDIKSNSAFSKLWIQKIGELLVLRISPIELPPQWTQRVGHHTEAIA